MLRRKITTSGNSAALVLSQDLLGLMGVKVGDDVEIEVSGTSLIVKPIDEKRRKEIFKKSLEKVLVERRDLFERLARGDGTPKPKSRTKP
jgi:antitoxin component of MazEF toxin-antitoxin module